MGKKANWFTSVKKVFKSSSKDSEKRVRAPSHYTNIISFPILITLFESHISSIHIPNFRISFMSRLKLGSDQIVNFHSLRLISPMACSLWSKRKMVQNGNQKLQKLFHLSTSLLNHHPMLPMKGALPSPQPGRTSATPWRWQSRPPRQPKPQWLRRRPRRRWSGWRATGGNRRKTRQPPSSNLPIGDIWLVFTNSLLLTHTLLASFLNCETLYIYKYNTTCILSN